MKINRYIYFRLNTISAVTFYKRVYILVYFLSFLKKIFSVKIGKNENDTF